MTEAILYRTTSSSEPRTSGGGPFKFLLGLLLGSLICQSLQFSYGVQQQWSCAITKTNSVENAAETTASSSSSSSSPPLDGADVALGLTERMAYYKQRYNYHPPTTVTSAQASQERGNECAEPKNDYEYSKFFSQNLEVHSRLNEDKTIYNVFFKKRSSNNISNTTDGVTNTNQEEQGPWRGTFLELGAFNGMNEANSRFFDLCLGWEGLLIEGNPNPNVWGRLVTSRPTAHRMNFVPSCNAEEMAANKTITFHPNPFTNAGIEAQDQGVQIAYNGLNNVVEVPCGSLTQVLLDLFPHGRLSFFSLDVEGSEHLVLEKIDFSKVYIEILMVEVKNNYCSDDKPCESRDRTRQILAEAGYVRFSSRIQASDVFVHQRSTDLLELAQKAGWIATTQ